ncbi:MAG TPA: hypothetical protein VH475_08045 [Tepidisphaeraceae bacterium]|jgi:hypothetical protein
MPARRLLTDADRVWNRACYREGTNRREGDLALGALLLVDGYIQNGGVTHAFDLTPEELAEGIIGYEFFGLHEMAAVIKPHRGEQEAEFNKRYHAFTRGDNLIIKKFQQMFREHPERFAPVGDAAAG